MKENLGFRIAECWLRVKDCRRLFVDCRGLTLARNGPKHIAQGERGFASETLGQLANRNGPLKAGEKAPLSFSEPVVQ